MQKRYDKGKHDIKEFSNCLGRKNQNYVPQVFDNTLCRCRWSDAVGNMADPIFFTYSNVVYVDVSDPKNPKCNYTL